jgi:mRNA-degrading endonuclease RelE of RelBE toxin-antitoxin system
MVKNYIVLRFGDYRIIFFIDEDTRTINIVKIGHRKEVYDD